MKKYIAVATVCILSLIFCSCSVKYVGSETRLTTTAISTAKPEMKYAAHDFVLNLCTTEDWLEYDNDAESTAKITADLPNDWQASNDEVSVNGKPFVKMLPIVSLQDDQTVLETYLTGYTGKKPNEICRKTVFLQNYTARLVETKESGKTYGEYCYTYYIPIDKYVVRVAFYSDNKTEDEETTEIYRHICDSIKIYDIRNMITTEPTTEE